MENLGWYNGSFGPLEEMRVPMLDRGCYFGDGVYDAGPCRNYHIFALDEHVSRFYRNAARLDIEPPMERDAFIDLLQNLVRELDSGSQFVYYQLTRGTSLRSHDYAPGKGNLWVMLKPAVLPDGLTPLRLITTQDTRFFHCDIKTLNLIPSVLAAQKAKLAGCQEAVFYRPGGRVTECAHSNVHIIRDGTIVTAPCDNLILPGIARAHLLQMCEKLSIPARETPFSLQELMDAEEVLVTSSSQLCMRACEIDGRAVGMRRAELVERLRAALMEEFMTATA